MLSHITEDVRTFDKRCFRPRHKNQIIPTRKLRHQLPGRFADDAAGTVAFDRVSRFFAGGNAHPNTVRAIFQNISDQNRRHKGLALRVSAAKAAVFTNRDYFAHCETSTSPYPAFLKNKTKKGHTAVALSKLQ